MKLTGARAKSFLLRPDFLPPAILLFGTDALRIHDVQKDLTAKFGGETLEQNMCLSKLSAGDLRSDKTLLIDAMKAIGFFPGQRIVVLEGVGDAHVKSFEDALSDWSEGDALIIAAAEGLRAGSKLRKLFEGHDKALAIGIYEEEPTSAGLLEAANKKGLVDFTKTGEAALVALGMSVDPPIFARFLEKLDLYKLNDPSPISEEDIACIAPLEGEIGIDALAQAVAEGKQNQIGPLLSRFMIQGGNPNLLALSLSRHFRVLYSAASSFEPAEAVFAAMRPPIFGVRRAQMVRQSKTWGLRQLESALRQLFELEGQLRSSTSAPAWPLLERVLIRLARLAR